MITRVREYRSHRSTEATRRPGWPEGCSARSLRGGRVKCEGEAWPLLRLFCAWSVAARRRPSTVADASSPARRQPRSTPWATCVPPDATRAWTRLSRRRSTRATRGVRAFVRSRSTSRAHPSRATRAGELGRGRRREGAWGRRPPKPGTAASPSASVAPPAPERAPRAAQRASRRVPPALATPGPKGAPPGGCHTQRRSRLGRVVRSIGAPRHWLGTWPPTRPERPLPSSTGHRPRRPRPTARGHARRGVSRSSWPSSGRWPSLLGRSRPLLGPCCSERCSPALPRRCAVG